jgi:pSer/pThr/pTyr-binding forkhead associated (FHA) protein
LNETLIPGAPMKQATINFILIRQIIFVIGLLFIIVGTIFISLGNQVGTIFSAIFGSFGTAMSFAQFAIGFSSLKPAESTLAQVATPVNPPAKAKLVTPLTAINLGPSQLLIGRSPDNQCVLNDPQVSVYHAAIHPEGSGYTIIDLASSNGTWVNGQQLPAKTPYVLRSRDTIRIGSTTFIYEAIFNPADVVNLSTPVPSIAPPPPNFAQRPYAGNALQNLVPTPSGSEQKRYVNSGIASVITGILFFIDAPLAFVPTHSTFLVLIDLLIFASGNICILAGIRGFYLKQAQKGGWTGVVGTLMLVGGVILNVLLALILCFLYVAAMTGQSISVQTINELLLLLLVNALLLIIGDIILGISMIRAAVYPRWAGITLIIIGVLNAFTFLPPVGFVVALLAAAFWTQCGITLMQPFPKQPQL